MRKKLEALVVPTGPSKKIDEQRATAGARSFIEKEAGLDVYPYIIITGIYNNGVLRGSQTEKIQEVLNYYGIPNSSIIHENKSRDTRENVIYTGKILRKELTNLAELNTDKWHAARMAMLFQKAIQSYYAPQGLKLTKNTTGIDRAYPLQKEIISYFRDLILPINQTIK